MQISNSILSADILQSVTPQLLVSVRDVTEAKAAASGGCNILDIKEPNNGSLGMADMQTISAIVGWVNDRPQLPDQANLPVSAALGEVTDYAGSDQSANVFLTLPVGLSFCKLGLSGLLHDANWVQHWLDVRHRFEAVQPAQPGWIAVAYADWEPAKSPAPVEVIQAAIATECVGLLIDTYCKDGRGLLDHLQINELSAIAKTARDNNLLFAVAGSLHADILVQLVDINPHVIAIRSAACVGGDRKSAVHAEAVQNFKHSVTDIWLKG